MGLSFHAYRFYFDQEYLIAALVAGIWFYRMARAEGRNAVAWAARGFLACLAPNVVWRLFLDPMTMTLWTILEEVPPFVLTLAFDSIGVALGAGFAFRRYRMQVVDSGGAAPSTSAFRIGHLMTAILVCLTVCILWNLVAYRWVRWGLGYLLDPDGLPGFIVAGFLAGIIGVALGLAVWYAIYSKYLRAPGFPGTLLAIVSVALLYVIGDAVMLAMMLEWGARPIPLILFAGVVVLYIVAIRHALARNHGKATGFMIAAGIINLPIGIVALVTGIVARRAWKKSLARQASAEGQGAPAGSPAGAAD